MTGARERSILRPTGAPSDGCAARAAADFVG